MDPKKIDTIENPLSLKNNIPISKLDPPKEGKAWKLGFFGQINYYKGLDVIVEGLHLAISRGAKIQLGIHGTMSAVTGAEYIDKLKASIDKLSDNATFFGAYAQENVQNIMRDYHFIVMGSRWYENSPVVIQESISAGRPLIVPRHGGMLEKTEGISIAYNPGEPIDLANCLTQVTHECFTRLQDAVGERRGKMDSALNNNFSRTLAVYSNTIR